MLTSNELLTKRFITVAPDPGGLFIPGDILEADFEDPELFHFQSERTGPVTVRNPELFAGNFRELGWWECRKIEDMPDYIAINQVTV